MNRVDDVDGVDGKARHEFDARQSEQTGDDKHADNNNSLWPVLSFLIVVVVFAAVAFVLVIHHYRYRRYVPYVSLVHFYITHLVHAVH